MRDERELAIAHEVKNPLALIRDNMDLINPLLKDKEEEKYIKLIYKELDRINAVLDSYLQPGRDLSVIFLEDLICDVIDEYHITEDKRVEFIIEATGEDLCVLASYSKLCILFFNLFKNAVEAVEDKGSIIARIDREGNMARVTIEDNGRGIDDSLRAVIGKPFVTSKSGGMGLGLTICRKIIDEYNGKLSLENSDGGGCRVGVKLKLYKMK